MTNVAVHSVCQGSPVSRALLPFAPAERAASPIVLVTAQPLFRAALSWALLRIRPHGEIREVGRVAEALELLRREPCALVVIDEDPLDCGALDAVQAIRAAGTVPVALLSSDPRRASARRAFDHGACGFIAKSAPLEEMAAALHKLTVRAAPGRSEKRHIADSLSRHAAQMLTPAQIKVLALMEQGQLNKQIAYELGIAELTVKAHVSAVLRKLNVQNRVQATLVANRQHARAPAYPAELGA